MLGRTIRRYFGDIVDVVAKNYFGVDVSIKALWFVPLNNPMKLLVYSMLFGTIQFVCGSGNQRIYAFETNFIKILYVISYFICIIDWLDFDIAAK